MKRLVIISHTEHYTREGQIVGWGPTIREIDYLSSLFDTVAHIAPLHTEPAPESAISYSSNRVELRSIPVAGGISLVDKLQIVRVIPVYLEAIVQELANADVVHVRCPANVSLIALLTLALLKKPQKRWIKYAGNWQPQGKEALSYTLQRWWLRHDLSRAKVTVNGRWNGQPSHVHSFFNPCLTDDELEDGRIAAETKRLESPLKLLFVGRLDSAKGVGRVLEIARRLRSAGCIASIDLIGDGPERPAFEEFCRKHGLEQDVRFHGWKPREELANIYGRAHILLIPSISSEGWPKVISEAMAYGVVPLASNISSIPQYLTQFETGRTFPPLDVEAFVGAALWYTEHPQHWKQESENCVRAARFFTYRHYLAAVQELLDLA